MVYYKSSQILLTKENKIKFIYNIVLLTRRGRNMKLKSFLEKKPAYRNIPILIQGNKIYSFEEAVNLGKVIPKNFTDNEAEILAEVFYKNAVKRGSTRRIASFGPKGTILLTMQDAVEHIQKKTDIGKWLSKTYKEFLKFILRRLEGKW